jgi:hypothetical protein
MRFSRIAQLLLFLVSCLLPALSQGACNVVNGKAYGDCEGVVLSNNSKPSRMIQSVESEHGIIRGATIQKGGSLELAGISNGNIVVNQGGTLRVTGTVSGTVQNLGGRVQIDGTVQRLHVTAGRTTVAGNVGEVSGQGLVLFRKGAVLRGVPFRDEVTWNASSR